MLTAELRSCLAAVSGTLRLLRTVSDIQPKAEPPEGSAIVAAGAMAPHERGRTLEPLPTWQEVAMNITIRRALLLSAVSALLAAPTLTLDGQAAAQTVEELTVTGRYGPGGEPQSLSQAVSYADLDLGAEADRDEFKQRIRLTARYLCEKLGEPEATAAPAPSCRQAAERDALAKADDVFKAFRPRGPNWARGKAWVPPYSKPQR